VHFHTAANSPDNPLEVGATEQDKQRLVTDQMNPRKPLALAMG
jgi:hypothetical protein